MILPRDGTDESDHDAAPGEAPIGELFGRLIDDGKAYATAEIDLVKARGLAQVDRAKRPAILGSLALFFALAGVIALVLTLVLSLASLIGPLAGGLLATFITLAIAGILGRAAAKSWQAGQ